MIPERITVILLEGELLKLVEWGVRMKVCDFIPILVVFVGGMPGLMRRIASS